MTPMFFRDAQGVLLVCDMTDKSSLFGLRDWEKSIKDHAPEKISKQASLGICIAGNKVDLDDLQVREDELKEFSEYIGCSYVLTSAWQNKGIEVTYNNLGSFQENRSRNSFKNKKI